MEGEAAAAALNRLGVGVGVVGAAEDAVGLGEVGGGTVETGATVGGRAPGTGAE